MKRHGLTSELQNFAVKIHHKERGELGEGVLSFGAGRWADIRSKNSFSNFVTDGERIDLVKAIADNGRTFTLCKCLVHEFVLFADYVLEADIEAPEFDQIVVRYSEISEWFLHWQNIEGNVGEQLTWTRTSKPMSVVVSTGEESFTLTSDYVGTRDKLGEETVLHEHVEFSFNTTGKAFGLPDLKSKTLELSCLLDDVHLARMTGSAEFFAVTKEKLDELMHTTEIRFLACFIREPDGELNFSQEYVAKYKNWQNSHPRYSGPLLPENIFGIDNDAVKFVAHGYFECGEERLEVHHMWIVDRSRVDGNS
jgi:hypothetical protein